MYTDTTTNGPASKCESSSSIQTATTCNSSSSSVFSAPTCKSSLLASGHVLVNQERTLKCRPKVQRSSELDQMAQRMAQEVSELNDFQSVFMERKELQASLGSKHVAQLMQRGSTVAEIHESFMTYDIRAKRAILSVNHKEMGMGTARCDNNEIVLVQLFRG